MTKLLRLGLLVLVCSANAALARDWFVREGAQGGDGSQGKPFGDPWQALDVCEANDAIHVTGGKYFGRNRVGYWVIPFDGVQVIGGYDKDFTSRDPWANRTELLWDKTSKNWPKEDRVMSNMKGVVIDGLTIDMRDQNKYQDDAQSGRVDSMVTPDAMRFSRSVTVRNCVIVNPDAAGITVVQGSTVENNLIMNAYGWGVTVNQGSNEGGATATVRNNTIAFSQDPKEPGTGRYQGAAIAALGPVAISNNILANSDNNAIYMTTAADKVSITGNLFFMNLFSNLKVGDQVAIDDKGMDQFEELGLKAHEGNEVKNPGFELDPKWLDGFSKRTAQQPGKLEMNDLNKARQLLGLNLIGSGGAAASGVCPAYELDKVYKLLAVKAKQGAHRLKLEVKLQGGGEIGPQRSYAKSDVSSWVKNPAPVDGKALEIVVAIGTGGANVSGLPSSMKKEDHEGATGYVTTGDHESLTLFYKRGSSAQRFVDDNAGWYTGQGTPQKTFVARGVAYKMNSLPKAGFFVEKIEPNEGGSSAGENRVKGRDWFVRMGATGGDGSKDKPFKDPWQALEKVEAGDSVHVAEGEYFGKLKTGKWKIDTASISLIGGYDKDFTERNPWKHPTRLYTPADFKGGSRDGYTIEGAGDHSGAIVDGFVFDKKLNNLYQQSGDLNYSDSTDKREHIWFAKPGCIIRNNVFLNGDEGALRVGGGITIENNIIINHAYRGIRVEHGFGGSTTIRSNTIMFSWDPIHFGQGHGSNGYLIGLEGSSEAIIDNNILEFADNDAIRMATEAKFVELTNNAFSKNLWSNVQRVGDWVTVDDREWSTLADLKFKKLSGNVLAVSGVPLEKAWFDVYVNRVAPVPGKVKMDDWNQLREMLGQPVIATGSQAGSGFAPAYDWKSAIALFPKNPKVTQGARAKSFPVKFDGVTRTEEKFDYAETSWDVAKSAGPWDALAGKRVSIRVVIKDPDNQYHLDDLKEAAWQAFMVVGPQGIDSGGLPMRMYVKRGTKQERTMQQAKSYTGGDPREFYVIKGVARANRQLQVEVIEKTE